ncbi:MAG: hypothetical protein U1E15_11400 [Hyphomicrobiales bacterium]
MLQNLFRRNRHVEDAADETATIAQERLLGRMENMLDGMAERDVLRGIRFATIENTPSYLR